MARKIDLPSGAWVEIRKDLRAKDRFAVQDVATLEVGEGRNKASLYGMQNDMRNALLGRIITAWSYPVPILGEFVPGRGCGDRGCDGPG